MSELQYQLDMYRLVCETSCDAFLFYSFEEDEVRTLGKWNEFFPFEIKTIEDLSLLYDNMADFYVEKVRNLVYLEKRKLPNGFCEALNRNKKNWYSINVTVEYDENGKPFRLEAVVLSTQHDEKVTQEQILTDTNGNEMIMLRGTCYPIIRMREKFEMSTGETDIEKGILMLVESDGKSVCLFADRLIGEQQIVVKPFPQYVAQYDLKSRGLSGCSIMGDGTISLIVDVNNVIKKQ